MKNLFVASALVLCASCAHESSDVALMDDSAEMSETQQVQNFETDMQKPDIFSEGGKTFLTEYLNGLAEEASSAEDAARIGKCEITVWTSKYCYNLTQKSCYQTAANVGGTAVWTGGARCK